MKDKNKGYWVAFSWAGGFRRVSEEEVKAYAVTECIALAIFLAIAMVILGTAMCIECSKMPPQMILPH
jgi:hypothetical protein